MFTRQNTIARYVLLACLVTAVFGTSFSYATTLQKFSLDDLVAHADTIIVGRCEKTENIWLDRKIYTIATIRVSQSVKGKASADNSIKVCIPGGRVDKPIPVKLHVPGAAKVVQGEEMVLFLKARGIKKQQHRFVGMSQGKIPIKIDAKTSEKLVRYGGIIKGVKMVDRQGKLLSSRAQMESTKQGSLKDFLSNIKQIINEQDAKAKEATEQNSHSENSKQNEKGGVK